MVVGGKKRTIAITWRNDFIRKVNDHAEWMLEISGGDPVKEKELLRLPSIEFYRFYNSKLKEFDRIEKRNMELRAKANKP